MLICGLLIAIVIGAICFLWYRNYNSPFPVAFKRILFITREDRKAHFIDAHDANIREYCRLHNYTYRRLAESCTNYPVYWCKVSDVARYLQHYDYVVWLDSDTHINQLNRRIETILNKDITIARDRDSTTYNAGVFAVRNSDTGALFLKDCLDYFESKRSKCVGADGELVGPWSGNCYEQGVMNLFLKSKYKDHVHVTREVSNSLNCDNTYMITHLFRSSPSSRYNCIANSPAFKGPYVHSELQEGVMVPETDDEYGQPPTFASSNGDPSFKTYPPLDSNQ